jgi:DNA-binding transcriptional MerR regulator
MELLRKKDLHPAVGVAKSTVADWIEEFNVYIPKVKHGSINYYKPETIDVLLFIKQCRDQNYQKHQIMEMLAEKGFPITVEDAVEDVKKALEGDTPRDTLLAVMQTMGQAVSRMAEQDGRLDEQERTLKTLQEKQDGQDERLSGIEKRTDEIEYLKKEIETLKKELAAAQEEKKKGFFARLFGKK